MQSQLMATVVVSGIFLILVSLALLIVLLMRRLEAGPKTPAHDGLDPTTEAFLESAPMPAVVFGQSLRRAYANPAYLNNEELVRRVSRQEWFQRALMEAFVNANATSRPSSSDFPEDVHVMPLPGDLVVAVLVDQSERYETAAMREDFIANAGHELNTPAAAISLLAEALMKTVEKGSPSEMFAKSLIEESDRLSALTRDIVLLSQAQAPAPAELVGDEGGRPFDVVAVAEGVLESHAGLAEQMGVGVVLNAAQRPTLARGTGAQTEIALGNLLENAIQYSPAGSSVQVSIRAHDDLVTVDVADQGPGIPQDQQSRIFQRFYRLDPARSRQVGGTGLGLSIARNTVRNMGGDVTVQSVEGGGSTFTITLLAASKGSNGEGEL